MSSNQPIDPRGAIERFQQQRSAGPVGLARYAPESWAQANDCLANVLTKVKLAGGQAVFGWTFVLRQHAQYGNYLTATNHAVWHSPADGTLVDITPLHTAEHHHPFQSSGNTVFLVDMSASPQQQGNALTLLPLLFVALTPEPNVEAYLARLAMSEQQQWQQQVDQAVRHSREGQ